MRAIQCETCVVEHTSFAASMHVQEEREQERKDYRRSSERAVMDRNGSVTLVTSHAVARIVAVVEWCSPSADSTSTPTGSPSHTPSPPTRIRLFCFSSIRIL